MILGYSNDDLRQKICRFNQLPFSPFPNISHCIWPSVRLLKTVRLLETLEYKCSAFSPYSNFKILPIDSSDCIPYG